MYTKQDIISSMAGEAHLITHLYAKVQPEHLVYRPTEGQRSLEELLRYISTMGEAVVRMLAAKAYNPEEMKAMRLANEAKSLDTFPQMVLDQHHMIASYIEGLAEDDLAEELDLFGSGKPMAVKTYLLEIVLKNFTAYRMQLFLYLKSGCGLSELNTNNLWMGKDA